MFRTKLTLAGLAVAALVGAVAPGAFAAHDSWYSYATSLTNTQRHDPWFAYAVSLTEAQPSARFITDTLAPGGSTPAQSYRLITDTLAPGGTAPAQSYRFITDTLAPGGGPSVVSAPSRTASTGPTPVSAPARRPASRSCCSRADACSRAVAGSSRSDPTVRKKGRRRHSRRRRPGYPFEVFTGSLRPRSEAHSLVLRDRPTEMRACFFGAAERCREEAEVPGDRAAAAL